MMFGAPPPDEFAALSIHDCLKAKDSARGFTNLSRVPIMAMIEDFPDYKQAFEGIFLNQEDALSVSFKRYFLKSHQSVYRAMMFFAMQADYIQSSLVALTLTTGNFPKQDVIVKNPNLVALVANLYATVLISSNNEEKHHLTKTIQNITNLSASRYQQVIENEAGQKIVAPTALGASLDYVLKALQDACNDAAKALDILFDKYPKLKPAVELSLQNQANSPLPTHHVLYSLRSKLVHEQTKSATNATGY
jgi:hypothetical protein